MFSHAYTPAALAFVASIALAGTASAGVPSESAFNYQGKLAHNGTPLDEICEMTVSLWDAEGGGFQHGPTLVLNNVPVEDGVFNILLDFGTDAIVNGGRYLDITVDCPTGGVASLSPRQQLDPTLFAVMATSAIGDFKIYEPTTRLPLITFLTAVEKGDAFAEMLISSTSSPLLSELSHDGLFLYQETGPDTDICYGEFLADPNTGGELRLNRDDGSQGASLLPDSLLMFAEGDPTIRVNLQVNPAGSLLRLNRPNNLFGALLTPGSLGLYAVNGSPRVENGIIDQSNGDGFINVRLDSGNIGTSIVGGTVNAENLFVSGTKSFRIPNPDDANTELFYVCPEGPEAAAYVRGTAKLIDGIATITFPQHFRSVTNHETMTVNLTPRSAGSMGLAVIERSNDGFVVRELANGTGSYEFDYYVMAVRSGYEDFEVVRSRESR